MVSNDLIFPTLLRAARALRRAPIPGLLGRRMLVRRASIVG
jgi:hypothetical protein